ncbi:MAG: hypothetical protein ACSHW7_00220 [Patiriisocius sp.]|uniref:hypothetical protein n=1 Tax=Patiriisocius sp. TaxID=2822396 RepID=UPI003EF0EB7A
MSCSEDDTTEQNMEDDEQEIVLQKTKTIISTSDGVQDEYIYYYNELGNIKKSSSHSVGVNEEDDNYAINIYDSQQNLLREELFFPNGDFDRNLREYTYNNQQQLISMKDYGDQTTNPKTTTFTYSENRVDFVESISNRSGYFIFDSLGRIIESMADKNGIGQFRYNYYTYENNQIKSITYLDTTYTYSTNEIENPLFNNFVTNPIQYLIVYHYIYDIDFNTDRAFSANLIANIDANYQGSSYNFEQSNYQYNENNYPIFCSFNRSDDLQITTEYSYR